MEEENTPVETTQEETQKSEIKNVHINSDKPLAGQVDKFLKAIPEEKQEETQETEEASTDSAKETPPEADEVKIEEDGEEVPEDVELEDLPEQVEYDDLPDWQKYIIDGLPTIQVIGHQGEGKDKTFSVKRLEDLPDDFEFASKREELRFTAALSAQEINARDLLNQYRSEEQKRSQAQFEQLEAIDIQNDIMSLQKQGVLPKFKYAPNDPRFDDDPAVAESNKIYDFYKKINDEYYNKYNGTGRMYRVSYEDAAYRYYALHPKEATQEVKQAIKKQEAKTPTQEQREKAASRIGAPQGSDAGSKPKAFRPGTSLDQVYQAYKRGII